MTLDWSIATWLSVSLVVLLGGAVLLALLPGRDRLVLRLAAVLTSTTAAVIVGVVAIEASLQDHPSYVLGDSTLTMPRAIGAIAISLTWPLALRAGAARIVVGMKSFCIGMLLAQASAIVAALGAPSKALPAMSCLTLLFVWLTAQFGSGEKLTAALRLAAVHLTCDLFAGATMMVLTLQPSGTAEFTQWSEGLMMLPCAARLALGPMTALTWPFLDVAPLGVAAGAMVAWPAFAFNWLLELDATRLATLPAIGVLLALAPAIAGVLALADDDLRRLQTRGLVTYWTCAVTLWIAGCIEPVTALALAMCGAAAAVAGTISTGAYEARLDSRSIRDLMGMGIKFVPITTAWMASIACWCFLLATWVVPVLRAASTYGNLSDVQAMGIRHASMPLRWQLCLMSVIFALVAHQVGGMRISWRLVRPSTRVATSTMTQMGVWQIFRLFLPVIGFVVLIALLSRAGVAP